ncbi:hypothetical protein ACTOB_005550 [Actinoplanes oblitus]|uniref:Lantibiotic dehydratase N-terminal domain-containing protein n=1 Tax=Actinoplanes oblitus TaxID=3040509 RepID=A0ABY8WAU4_9ACTN|nr:hypothetical protein [Actinoplanes oblitus]WIM93568.1 hypothetical protein ACTOB_005550 [Actinoplanes oblitus]
MRSLLDGHPRLLAWQRVREFAVPPTMIESTAARRLAGDWAGACAASRVDPELDPRAIGRRHGPELAAEVRSDLRHLVPDLLRWHFPRVESGLLRPGVTVSLARYAPRLHLVARTPPAWADADQRIALALWDGAADGRHPHARPHRRFRLDLHRHLWDDRHTAELPDRAGAATWPGDAAVSPAGLDGCAVHRWAAEAEILRSAEGREDDPVFVRLTARDHRELPAGKEPGGGPRRALEPSALVLPDAATWLLPDLELLRAGLIEAGQLHPLVAESLIPALAPAAGAAAPGPAPAAGAAAVSGPAPAAGAAAAPGHAPASREPAGAGSGMRLVDCRGERHRVGLVDGVLSALDHEPDELLREEILVAFGGTPLPCLRVIDRAIRRPDTLADIRARLDHGDLPGALAAVEALLGPGATLRDGPLRDELARTAERHLTYGLYRAGLAGHCPPKNVPLPRRRITKVKNDSGHRR